MDHINIPLPNARHLEWYGREKIAFIHFSMNTFTDVEWGDGTETPAAFAPTELDCRQWARVLKEGGFTAAILTAKHHDGFCLWPSAYTEHSVKYSPEKRDVVREFTDACREFGIKPGLYLSPWDRNHPTWGTDAYNDVYAGQLTELMTGYGTIWECWWDGAGSTEAVYDWKRWADIVRRHQPQCLIFGSMGASEYVDVRWVGNEQGRAGEECWATLRLESLRKEVCQELNTGDPNGELFVPAETNVSIRPGWFYHKSQDDQVMDVEALVGYWFRSAGRNTTILLNLPPDRRGLIHQRDAESVRLWDIRMKEIFRENLAEKAAITGGEDACNLVSPDRQLLYRAESGQVELSFEEMIELDCLRLEEAIEFGHRIRRFRVEALTQTGWETLLQGECIGNCRAARFPSVRVSKLRLTIDECVATPVLRFFGAYLGAQSSQQRQQSPECPPVIRTEHRGNAIDIELAGIYPFNTVCLAGAQDIDWQVWAFNGTRYESVAQTNGQRCSFPAQTGSYRLRVTTEGEFPPGCEVKVLWIV